MLDMIMNAGMAVHILWGIGLLGLLLKMIGNCYVKKMMKESENMATTRKRALRVMRQKYENRINLGLVGNSAEAFVEKNVRALNLLGFPIYEMARRGILLIGAVVIYSAGAFCILDLYGRGSPYVMKFVANSVGVCAFLYVLENIFLTRNKVEILKANIRDYFENMSEARFVKNNISENKQIGRVREQEDVSVNEAVAATKTEDKNDDALNSFLKEFFSEKT